VRRLALAIVLGLSAFGMAPAVPQDEPSGPPPLDPAWRMPEVIAFIGVKKGDAVADIIGGRLTGSLASAVGPTGKVYAMETAEVVKVRPDVLDNMHKLAAQTPNVVVSADPVASPLPKGLDAVVIRQNYHDLYDKFMGPADVAAFNRAVFSALKPGGVYVVLDHAAASGSGIAATETLHRIDPARVKADVLAAGFKLESESSILANPADDHTKNVFDPSIRGHTDQFLLKFNKPK
jgi:predicted methyltransferase